MAMTTGPRPDPYLQAGLVYGVLGMVVLLLAVATPDMIRPERRSELLLLAVSLPIFALFTLVIAIGDRLVARLLADQGRTALRASHAGRWFREKLVMLAALAVMARALVFGTNGLGWRAHLWLWPPTLSFESAAPEPRLLLAALLMATIGAFLVRAAWLPFLRRLLGRHRP